jgi:hypothetical protein
MGREASCQCHVDGKAHTVKAVLESGVLILRGALKRTIAFPDITGAKLVGGKLEFTSEGETFSLELGRDEASRWLTALTRPRASLADKLGLKGDAKAYVIGSLEDETLREAVNGRQIDAPHQAALCIAMTLTPQQLEDAVAMHQAACVAPLWIAHPKGKKTELSEAVVRATMRSKGYIDTKVSAVSERLTATRYNLQSGQSSA